ncbi:DNA internalization-related competence protein ComEC/Rec2 [Marinobacter daepoensis]|uniref:DNA internalization-related competence protein ComEC/Rec2 n=1 Tax=Marinobacter daepoensis TaxID=262077 RepID=UPI0012EC1345|nr:DNA internalization-related competence protein ComEC/Rec2 [Marinobacter daepoensis]
MLAFSCGVILLYRLTTLPPYPWLIALGGGALLFHFRGGHTNRRWPVLVAGVMFGLAWASWSSEHRLAERLPSELEGQRVLVSGYLCDLPAPGNFDSLRFSFCVTGWPGLHAQATDYPLPSVLRLTWYGREGRPLPDHRLKLEVVLKRPHGQLNPEGFRYEDWLFRHGYRATGSVKQVFADPGVVCGAKCRYHAWHWDAANHVKRLFGKAEQYALIASLLMGDRGGLTDEQWQILKATGTIHLVAISGLHLGLVAIGAGLMARRLWLLLPVGTVSEYTGRVVVFLVVVLGCVGYALLAGFTVPTRRALVMVIAGGWYLVKARQQGGWYPWILALMAVLLLDPFAPLDQGFWLSFGAVAVLLLVFSGRVGSTGWLTTLIAAQLAAFFGLWPLLMAFQQTQPLAGLLANLLAIPWVSLVVMPTLFLGSLLVWLSDGVLLPWVSAVFDVVLGTLWWWLEWVGQFRFGHMQPLAMPLAAGLALLALYAIRWHDWKWRLVFGATVLLLAAPASFMGRGEGNEAVPRPEVRILDVGQGLSVVVRAGSRVMVYDTGPEVEGAYSAAESVLIPNLRAMGVATIDLLVLSHGDKDHAGGLAALADAFPVKRVISGEPALISGRTGLPVESCLAARMRWPGLDVAFWRMPGREEGNDASCVVRLYHPATGRDAILTGDISRRVETRMLGSDGPGWVQDQVLHRIVLAPHHGSKTSSSDDWIKAIGPNQVIYTAGYRHHYGHPHPDVTERYRRQGVGALSTACSGEIRLSFGENGRTSSVLWRSQPFWISSQGLTRSQCKIP